MASKIFQSEGIGYPLLEVDPIEKERNNRGFVKTPNC